MRLCALTAARTTCSYQRAYALAYAFDRLSLTGQHGSGAHLANTIWKAIAGLCAVTPARLRIRVSASGSKYAILPTYLCLGLIPAPGCSCMLACLGGVLARSCPDSGATTAACDSIMFCLSMYQRVGICWDTNVSGLDVQQHHCSDLAAGCNPETFR